MADQLSCRLVLKHFIADREAAARGGLQARWTRGQSARRTGKMGLVILFF